MLPRIVVILFIRLNTNIIIFKAIYNIGFIFPFFIIYIFIGINIITNIQIAITSVIFILKIELNRKIKQKNNKKPMFHVEQSDFRRRFHVKREPPKSHCLVGFWRLFTLKIGIFVLSPCKILQ